MDIVGASSALLIAAPAMLLSAFAIKLDSRGPVFFWQYRLGENGKPFRFYKFRSMSVDAPNMRDSLSSLNETTNILTRMRTLAMQVMRDLMADIDVYIAPSFNNSNLMLTNLTGHPVVVVPNGVDAKGASSSITFTGKLYGEAATLSVAKAYQDATRFHLRYPQLQTANLRE